MKKQSWYQLLSIQAGGALCLPVILVGQMICQKFGWIAAGLSIAFGNVLLLLLSLGMASLSTHRRQSTVEHAGEYFGNSGKKLLAALMMISTLGWFAIQVNLMSISLDQLTLLSGFKFNPIIINIFVGMLISSVMCFGMRAMRFLANFSAPILGCTILYVLLTTSGSADPSAVMDLSFLQAISIIIGANIAAVIDLPTFFQHARSKKDAFTCIILLFGFIVPLIEGVGVYLTSMTGGSSILDVFQGNRGVLWSVWISFFIFLCGWTTNNANLYSTIVSSKAFSKVASTATRALVLGGIGTIAACLNPLGKFEDLLIMLSVAVGSMGAVILSSYFLERLSLVKEPFMRVSVCSWILGVAIGLFSFTSDMQVTTVPVLDAFLTAAISQLSIQTILTKRKYETINHS